MYRKRDKVQQKKATENESEFNKKSVYRKLLQLRHLRERMENIISSIMHAYQVQPIGFANLCNVQMDVLRNAGIDFT